MYDFIYLINTERFFFSLLHNINKENPCKQTRFLGKLFFCVEGFLDENYRNEVLKFMISIYFSFDFTLLITHTFKI